MKKVIYIAGPISSPNPEEQKANIKRGRDLGFQVWHIGAVALIPHMNDLSRENSGLVSLEDIYLGDLELLKRCDAMIRVPGWEQSKGVRLETVWAKIKNIPVFDDIETLRMWLREQTFPPELK